MDPSPTSTLLTSCPVCGGKVSRNAKACPHCGEPMRQAAREVPHIPSSTRPRAATSGSSSIWSSYASSWTWSDIPLIFSGGQKSKRCPHCHQETQEVGNLCPHCGRSFESPNCCCSGCLVFFLFFVALVILTPNKERLDSTTSEPSSTSSAVTLTQEVEEEEEPDQRSPEEIAYDQFYQHIYSRQQACQKELLELGLGVTGATVLDDQALISVTCTPYMFSRDFTDPLQGISSNQAELIRELHTSKILSEYKDVARYFVFYYSSPAIENNTPLLWIGYKRENLNNFVYAKHEKPYYALKLASQIRFFDNLSPISIQYQQYKLLPDHTPHADSLAVVERIANQTLEESLREPQPWLRPQEERNVKLLRAYLKEMLSDRQVTLLLTDTQACWLYSCEIYLTAPMQDQNEARGQAVKLFTRLRRYPPKVEGNVDYHIILTNQAGVEMGTATYTTLSTDHYAFSTGDTTNFYNF